jgi:hypothetical protein
MTTEATRESKLALDDCRWDETRRDFATGVTMQRKAITSFIVQTSRSALK